jgi:hypothetical protein
MKQQGAVLSRFIPQYVLYAFVISGTSAVMFATDNFLSCFRVYGSSYHAFGPLEHRDVGDPELGILYHCNTLLYLR